MKFKYRYIPITLAAALIIFLIYVIFFVDIASWRSQQETIHNRPYKKGDDIQIALGKYYKTCNKYPTTEESLELLKRDDVGCNYVADEKIKKNDFINDVQNPFIYISDGKHYKLISIRSEYFEWSDAERFKYMGEKN